jgi:hypothetical protein
VQKKQKKRKQKKTQKKSILSYFSGFLFVLDSYLYFFIERYARQVSQYPHLVPKKRKKKQNKKIRKRACYRIFPVFCASLALIFNFPYRALGEMILEIPISSPKNHKKSQTTVKPQKKKEKGVVFANLASLDLLLFSNFVVAKIYRSLGANVKSTRATAGHERKNVKFALLSSLISLSFPTLLAKLYRYLLWANVKSTRATAGHKRNIVHLLSSLISLSFPTLLANLYRTLLRANVKSMRAMAGHKRKIVKFAHRLSSPDLCLFPIYWLHFIDLFGRMSSLCGAGHRRKFSGERQVYAGDESEGLELTNHLEGWFSARNFSISISSFHLLALLTYRSIGPNLGLHLEAENDFQ